MKIDKFNPKTQEGQFARLQVRGGTIGGNLVIDGDASLITLSGSNAAFDGTFIANTDLDFVVQTETSTTNVLKTYNQGSKLGLMNNSIFIDGQNVGINQPAPQSTVHIGDGFGQELRVAGTISASQQVIFSGLSTQKPTTTGSLWLSGSAGAGSKFLVVFTGE